MFTGIETFTSTTLALAKLLLYPNSSPDQTNTKPNASPTIAFLCLETIENKNFRDF